MRQRVLAFFCPRFTRYSKVARLSRISIPRSWPRLMALLKPAHWLRLACGSRVGVAFDGSGGEGQQRLRQSGCSYAAGRGPNRFIAEVPGFPGTPTRETNRHGLSWLSHRQLCFGCTHFRRSMAGRVSRRARTPKAHCPAVHRKGRIRNWCTAFGPRPRGRDHQ